MNVIELAREAGFDPHDMSADFTCNLKDIERFATLVRAAALEEAAVVIEDWDTDSLDPRDGAAAIRQLKETK